MMCKVLTYSLTLLTLLAGLFVVSACQKDDVGKSEVMMTFNTRAIVSDAESDADALERMKDLRVIMVRQDGTVVDNHLAPNINASSVKFTFSTPVKTGGEYFTFYAVANENALTPVPAEDNLLSWMKTCKRYVELTEQNITAIKAQQIGDGSAFTIPNGEAIPQTKIWTVYVPQQDKYAVPDPLQLEYVASKISVKFVNKTNESQSLSNIRITGITPNGKGRLFSDYIKQGLVDVYEEVYVTNDVILSDGIPFTAVNNLSAGATSDVQNYYTYPVDAANISNPMLYAEWGGKEFHMPIGVTSIPRNKHIEIVVNIIKDKLSVYYNVKDWKEHELNIGGAPTVPDKSDGYYVEDWFADNNINIGGDTIGENNWTLSDGTIISPDKVLDDWSSLADPNANNNLVVTIPEKDLVQGYEIILDFECAYKNCPTTTHFKIFFTTYQENGGNTSIELANSDLNIRYEYIYGKGYTRHLKIDETVFNALKKAGGQLVFKTVEDPLCDPNKLDNHPYGIKIIKYALINPLNL